MIVGEEKLCFLGRKFLSTFRSKLKVVSGFMSTASLFSSKVINILNSLTATLPLAFPSREDLCC